MIDVANHSLVGNGTAIIAALAAAPARSAPTLSPNRRWAITIIFAAALALVVSLAIFRANGLIDGANLHDRNVGQQLSEGATAVGRSVASLLGLRSPGERAVGALAILKQKRAPALHERALPKVRHEAVPGKPLAAASQPAFSPDIVPAGPSPLFSILSGLPQEAPVSIAAETLPPAILPGGAGVFIGSPTGPGFPASPVTPVNPTIPTTPGTPGTTDTPSTPGVPGVPEPRTWTMMLLGFVFMGAFAGLERRAAPRPASN